MIGAGAALADLPHFGEVWVSTVVESLRWAKGREVAMDEAAEAPKSRRRSRQFNVTGGRQVVHKVKVTPEQELRLQERARDARMTVSRLLVESALADELGETATARREVAVELFGAFRLLASIANNVNQIAKATNATGQWQDDCEATLGAARRTADRINAALEAYELT